MKRHCSCCTTVKRQFCGRIWDVPQLSDRKYADNLLACAHSGKSVILCFQLDPPHRESPWFSHTEQHRVQLLQRNHKTEKRHNPEHLYGPRTGWLLVQDSEEQTQQPLKRNICNHLLCCWEVSLIRQTLTGPWKQTSWETQGIPGQPGASSYGTGTFCPGRQACRNLIFTLLATIIPSESGNTKPTGVYVQPVSLLEIKFKTLRKR